MLLAAEEMTSLSRLFKSVHDIPVEEKGRRVISIKTFEIVPEVQTEEAPVSAIHFEKEAEQILQSAKVEAEMLVEQAMMQAEGLRTQMETERELLEQEKQAVLQQAQQEGFQRGLEEGKSQAIHEYSGIISMAQEVLEAAKTDYTAQVEASEETILQIAVKIAGKIIGNEITAEPSQLLSFVKRGLKEAKEQDEVRLHVHPSHYQFLLDNKEELLLVFATEAKLFIYPDADIQETMCVIESSSGRIDAGLDSQLKELKDKLFEFRGSGN